MLNPGDTIENWLDVDGNPAGGVASGVGYTISWQNGPLGRGEDRKAPNGAFVENILAAALQRIEHYQDSKFACVENERACSGIRDALSALDSRNRERDQRGVEGTHKE